MLLWPGDLAYTGAEGAPFAPVSQDSYVFNSLLSL